MHREIPGWFGLFVAEPSSEVFHPMPPCRHAPVSARPGADGHHLWTPLAGEAGVDGTGIIAGKPAFQRYAGLFPADWLGNLDSQSVQNSSQSLLKPHPVPRPRPRMDIISGARIRARRQGQICTSDKRRLKLLAQASCEVGKSFPGSSHRVLWKGGVETNPIHLSQAAKLSQRTGPPLTFRSAAQEPRTSVHARALRTKTGRRRQIQDIG